MNNKNTFTPVDKKERIGVLDALRGFAIFGILIINIGVFSGYSYMVQEEKADLILSDLNSTFEWIHSVFFSGKFYTLFSFLFGIGFAIQLIRAQKAGRSFGGHFSRRLFILLIIGAIHLWGIWFSDILVLYALCGFLLILFKGLPNKVLIAASILIMFIPAVNAWYIHTQEDIYTNKIYMILNEKWEEATLPNADDGSESFEMQDVTEVIKTGSWDTVFSFNYIGPLLRGYIILLDARLFKVLAIFILGLWAGRKLLSDKLHKNKRMLSFLAAAGFAIGIPLNIQFVSGDAGNPVTREAVSTFAYVSLTAGYAALFMLLYLTGLRNILTNLFSAVGKTALTNYILQSIICILLFYEAGSGLWKYFGSALLTMAVVIIFFFQVIISSLWLKRYKYGPLEWIWRVLTYGKYIPNKV